MKRWSVLIVCVVLLGLPAILAAQQTPLQQAQQIKADLAAQQATVAGLTAAQVALMAKVDALIASLGSATNQPPSVVCNSSSVTVTLPAAATLTCAVTDDGLPTGATVSRVWTLISGPGTAIFSAPTASDTQVSLSVPGTYLTRLTAHDTLLSASTDVQVVALPAPPPSTTALAYLGKLRDVVRPSTVFSADGQLDAAFAVTLAASKPVASMRLAIQSGVWDTIPATGAWCIGVALTATAPPLNATTCAVSFTPAPGSSFLAYASDYQGSPGLFPVGAGVTLTVTYADGTSESLTTVIGGPPPPPPPPSPCVTPCVLDPVGIVSFTASPDHATVTRYQFDALPVTSGAPLTADLGKPVPDSVAGCAAPSPCLHALLPTIFGGAALNVLYTATVTALDATGSTVSGASHTFMRTK